MALWRLGRRLASALGAQSPHPSAGAALWRVLSSAKVHLSQEAVVDTQEGVSEGEVFSAEAPSQARKRSMYRVQIVTGNVRGAGTPASVSFKLLGSWGESRLFRVADSAGFERGTVETYAITVDGDLGSVNRVYVQRAEVGASESGSGWFLDKVVVTGPGGEGVQFPCKQWLGDSDDGDITGPLERYLVPATFAVADEESQPVDVRVAGMAIPHPDKVALGMKGHNAKSRGMGGEDAYFYCHGRNGIFGMGVADGVYDWRSKGIDPSKFSGALMRVAYNMVREGFDDLVKVLNTAFRNVQSEGVKGSSTCCLLTINTKQGILRSSNMGDSGFLVIGRRVSRPETHVVFRTPQQEHSFGHPYQLGHHSAADPPKAAVLETFHVFPGDVVVMGSDGLFDNLSEGEIMREVEEHDRLHKSPTLLTHRLVELSFESSLDKRKGTPYSRAATEAFDMVYSGGKPDDITVLVGYIS
eukprot:evm.model.scf_3110.2 EVM.evm.TU.scf_3110.2   scf_3110:7571-12670(-)